ncbi:acyl-CoA dehydrogenase/oxidase C-terminal [Mycena latifolia]|nr:acyl-CoA dehydrogenase/oxidase C-terminal [Mycena latifolia]
MDGRSRSVATACLVAIQYNLVAGTMGAFVSDRDDILKIVNDIIDFKAIGTFCLTELDHGLDVFNLETTATLLDDGRFELHTPHPGAAKILPLRGNSAPINHCLTGFNCVILPSSALLGDIHISGSPRLHFLSSIWRIAVGALSLTSIVIPGLAIASSIALRYSLRRVVQGNDGAMVPIFSFRTQQIPICTTIAQAFVLRAFYGQAIDLFVDETLSPFVRHGIATCFKAVVIRDCLASLAAIAERCGAQGLFGYNQLIRYHDEIRGVAIAEGDILVLSIRLATELLLEKYYMPPSANPRSLLGRHEEGLMTKYRSIIANSGGHRSTEFASHVIPHCEDIVRAVGYRMAYDVAVAAEVPQTLIDIFVCGVVKTDLAWYIENQVLSSEELEDMQDSAIQRALPHAEEWVAGMKVEPYAAAPIVSDDAWDAFHTQLHSIGSQTVAKL